MDLYTHTQLASYTQREICNHILEGKRLYICLISIDRLLVLGAFLWDDPDEDQ